MDLERMKTVSEIEVNVIKNEILDELDVQGDDVESIIKTETDVHHFSQKGEFKEEYESFSIFLPTKIETTEVQVGVKEEIRDSDSPEFSNSSSHPYQQNPPSMLDNQRHNNRFICIFCNKAYNYLSHLKKHMRTHSGEKPYTCEICCKDFRCKGTLKVHFLTHTGCKPFKCQICEKEFQTSSNLKKHSLIHTDDKPFTCDVCHCKYRCKTQMKNHRMQHFGEKKYHCSFCDEKFSFLVSLKTHLLKHTGMLPPFKCDICNKSFKMSHHLKRHKKTHVGAPFICQKCNQEFLQLRELQRHSSDCSDINFGNLDYR